MQSDYLKLTMKVDRCRIKINNYVRENKTFVFKFKCKKQYPCK